MLKLNKEGISHMKRLLFALVLLAFISINPSFVQKLSAQKIANDFIKNDCDANSFHLYEEHNKGNVVIHEYVMMDCAPCVTAAKGLKSLLADLEKSYPNRVKMFSIGYDDSYTCQQMQTWKSDNSFNHQVFTQGASDLAYYGIMGMPTIVISAGKDHKVIYFREGYSPSQNTIIKSAITDALNSSDIELENKIEFSISPNPSSETISIKSSDNYKNFQIINLLGQVLIEDNFTHSIDISNLNSGNYLLKLVSKDNSIQIQKFIVSH